LASKDQLESHEIRVLVKNLLLLEKYDYEIALFLFDKIQSKFIDFQERYAIYIMLSILSEKKENKDLLNYISSALLHKVLNLF
jgi:hypothetical protein